MTTYRYQSPSHQYRFPLDNLDEALKVYRTHGWVVLSQVVDSESVDRLLDRGWDWLEAESMVKGKVQLDRKQPKTWFTSWPSERDGQIQTPGIGQAPFCWEARQNPGIVRIFQGLYRTSDLQVSYDTVNLIRADRKYHPDPLPPHLDERPGRPERSPPGSKSDPPSSQGFLNLIDSGSEDGGICFLDRSHLNSIKYVKKDRNGFQFVTNPEIIAKKMVSPNLRGGDFVLWDGRLVHGSAPPQPNSNRKVKGLRRGVIYINMYPRKYLSPKIRRTWEKWFLAGYTSCHGINYPRVKIRPPQNYRLDHILKEIPRGPNLFLLLPFIRPPEIEAIFQKNPELKEVLSSRGRLSQDLGERLRSRLKLNSAQKFYLVPSILRTVHSREGLEKLFRELEIEPRNEEDLIVAARVGNWEGVQFLLRRGWDPSIRDNQAIIDACEWGHDQVVQLLLEDPRVDPSARNHRTIKVSLRHPKVVIQLLKGSRNQPSRARRVDPTVSNSWVILGASIIGASRTLQILLEDGRADPSARDNLPLIVAASEGYLKGVKLLLMDSRVDPSAQNNKAIRLASEKGNQRVVELLSKFSRRLKA